MTIVLYATLALASCEKHDKEEDEKVEDVILLESSYVSTGHNDSNTVYEYDAQHRLTKRLMTPSMSSPREDKIIYRANEIVLVTDGWKTTFTQNGNKISFVTGANKSFEIELNAQGLPVKQTYIQVYGSSYWEMQTSTFSWENGNLIQQGWEQYREEDGIEYYSIGTVTYTYDTMKSPFYYCTTPKWFLMYLLGIDYCSVNNMETAKSSEKYSSKYGANSYVSTQTLVNTYNDDGFLVTRTEAGNTSGHFRPRFYYTNQ